MLILTREVALNQTSSGPCPYQVDHPCGGVAVLGEVIWDVFEHSRRLGAQR